MEKKEFKIGEVFQFGLVKLRVERTNCGSCEECFFRNLNCFELSDIVGPCFCHDREDNTEVIFKKVEE